MTKSTTTKYNITIAAEFIVILLLCMLCIHTCCSRNTEVVDRVTVDTLYRHSIDTIQVSMEKIRYKEVKNVDTLYVEKDDTLMKQMKVYEDSISTIWISGIEPEIDSIQYRIPRDTVRINKEIEHTIVKNKGWGSGVGIGIHVGYGVTFSEGKVNPGPYVGIGVSYSLGYFKIKK